MRKGLAVIILLSLALMSSSCGDIVRPTVDPDAHADVVGGVISNVGVIEVTSLMGATILATPTVEELLNAALEVEAIGNSTKDTINIVLDLLPEVGGWLAEIPDETRQAIDEIMGNVTELETVTSTTGFLQGLVDSGQYDDYEWLTDALEFGIELLEAGEDTIYNPAWYPYTAEPLLSFNTSQLMKEDLEGGIAGAVGCALADADAGEYDGHAIDFGGVVAGVDSSIADVISQLSGYW